MLRKRIIFTLIYADGYFHQSRNFRLQKVGDFDWLEKNYNFKNVSRFVDELIILNASKREKNSTEFLKIVRKLAYGVFIPISAGGGIRSMDYAAKLFNNGADKVVLNTPIIEDTKLVYNLVSKYGSQSIVASVDYKAEDCIRRVYIKDGRFNTGKTLLEYLEFVQSLDVGEIYINSIDKDGTGFGFDYETLRKLNYTLNIPFIVAGGAGNEKHIKECFLVDGVDAIATANLFNFIGNGLENTRKFLLRNQINITDLHSF